MSILRLQIYKKIIEYGWFFSKNLKYSLKYTYLSGIMSILTPSECRQRVQNELVSEQ